MKMLNICQMVLILLLSTMVKAYNKTNRIVLYYDEITIYPTGDKDNPVEHHYMLPFPQPYKNVSIQSREKREDQSPNSFC